MPLSRWLHDARPMPGRPACVASTSTSPRGATSHGTVPPPADDCSPCGARRRGRRAHDRPRAGRRGGRSRPARIADAAAFPGHRGRVPRREPDAARHARHGRHRDDGCRRTLVAATRRRGPDMWPLATRARPAAVPQPVDDYRSCASTATACTRSPWARCTPESSSRAISASPSSEKRSCGWRSGSATYTRAPSDASPSCRSARDIGSRRVFRATPRSPMPGRTAKRTRA